MSAARTTLRQRGFALLIVLWSLVLLSLILTQMLSAGRTEAQLAANLRNAAMAEAVADGAVEEALFHLAAHGPLAWRPEGTHLVRIGHGAAEVAIEDLSNKVNPNSADAALLQAMLVSCGASPGQAAGLSQAVIAWRGDADGSGADMTAPYRAAGLGYLPPREPMQSLDELPMIVGVTPQLASCLRPHMSLYSDGPASARSADPFVAQAVMVATQGGNALAGTPSTAGDTAVEITARATVPGGRFVRRATARLIPAEDKRPFRILRWEAGPG